MRGGIPVAVLTRLEDNSSLHSKASLFAQLVDEHLNPARWLEGNDVFLINDYRLEGDIQSVPLNIIVCRESAS